MLVYESQERIGVSPLFHLMHHQAILSQSDLGNENLSALVQHEHWEIIFISIVIFNILKDS
mgnify:CR=1 FL=1